MLAELLQSSALRQALVRYLGKEWSSSELEEWLVTNLQDILSSGDQPTIELANQVDALFVEKSECLLSEEQLTAGIKSLVSERSWNPQFDASGSANTVISTEPLLATTVLLRARHSFAPAEADR